MKDTRLVRLKYPGLKYGKMVLKPAPMATHTHLYLYLYYHCQNWLRGPHSGGGPAEGNKTGGPVGSGDTNLIVSVAWPPQCSRGTHLWACKTHEMREVGYGLE